MFIKYPHLERFGNDEVSNIELGVSYIFPKIDGTNGSVWIENGLICAGSRNRQLSLDNDNAGFMYYITNQENIRSFLKDNPSLRLYGERLVPHSLKSYRDDAWRKFYVFDVCETIDDEFTMLHYDEYSKLLSKYGIDYICPICSVKNATYDFLTEKLKDNVFLIKDGEGNGEGIVIKNYEYKNKFGRTTWAKIVTSEFKEIHTKEMGANYIEMKPMIEEGIVNKYVTKAFCEKELEKIRFSVGGNSKLIPRLLATIFYELIREESWNFIKENKNPIINFNTLNSLTIKKVKENLPHIF